MDVGTVPPLDEDPHAKTLFSFVNAANAVPVENIVFIFFNDAMDVGTVPP